MSAGVTAKSNLPGWNLPTSTLPRAKALSDAALGVGILTRFILRRNWLRILIWLVVLTSMVVLVIDSQRSLFPTQADRDAYAEVANTPAIAALTGLPYAAGSLGGILNIKLWMTVAIGCSLAVIFMVTRNGRTEEESGRTELLRAGVLGKHAYSLANWLVFSTFAVVVGVACAGAAVSQGLPADGASLMGASFAGVGFVFVGVAAVAGQLARTSRGANALASTVLAVSYLIRAAADINADGDKANWLTWLSPIGWGQQTRSYGENLWWPVGLSLAGGIILFTVALAIERFRDLGAGLLPDRVGPSQASALVRTQIGLSLRLQRGSLIGWALGIMVSGLFFGGVAHAMVDLLQPDSPIAQALIGGSANVLDDLLGFFLMANALLVAAFAVQSADSIRAEEAAGRTEIQWSSAISRVRWASARVVVPVLATLGLLALSGACVGLTYGIAVDDTGQTARFALASITYWPTALLVVGVVVLCAGGIPRAAGAVTWGLYGAVVIVSVFSDLFSLPNWVTKNTPFTAVPRLGTEFTVLPLLAITVLAVIAGGAGLWLLRRRDMISP